MPIRILGSGAFVPENIVKNEDFINDTFLDEQGISYPFDNAEIVKKFKSITGIEQRRYADHHILTSDMAFLASQKAIEDAGIDPETLDYVIVAHNFGNVKNAAIQTDILPSLASRVKHDLKIKNPKCVAYDLIFGCPGWLEGVIHAQAFIKCGMAKRCLIVGAEALSRVVDPYDRDKMIYSDGAGATVIGFSDEQGGIGGHASLSFTYDEAYYLHFGASYNKEEHPDVRYIKMDGRKIYEFALSQVPEAMFACVEAAGIPIERIKKVLIHQANEKMDEAIIQRFYKKYKTTPPEGIMPMSIHELGNSSVATIPTLYDRLMKNELTGHQVQKGDYLLFASVGAGMNINAMLYEV